MRVIRAQRIERGHRDHVTVRINRFLIRIRSKEHHIGTGTGVPQIADMGARQLNQHIPARRGITPCPGRTPGHGRIGKVFAAITPG